MDRNRRPESKRLHHQDHHQHQHQQREQQYQQQPTQAIPRQPSIAASSSSPCAPPHLWPLSPGFFSHRKLFIGHVHRLPIIPDLPSPSVAHLNGQPVQLVEIVGVIVSVEHKHKFISYTLDDGTGVISCKVWQGSDADTRTPIMYAGSLSKIQREPLQLGQTVRVLGRLNVFVGAFQLSVDSIRAEDDDVNVELLHWLDCITLYQEVYSNDNSNNQNVVADLMDINSNVQ